MNAVCVWSIVVLGECVYYIKEARGGDELGSPSRISMIKDYNVLCQ